MLQPKRTKFRKAQKGGSKVPRPPEFAPNGRAVNICNHNVAYAPALQYAMQPDGCASMSETDRIEKRIVVPARRSRVWAQQAISIERHVAQP